MLRHGQNNDRRLSTLTNYINLLGTSRYSAQEMQQAFFKLGLSFGATCQDEHFYISLTGLPASFKEGVALLEHLLADAQPNEAALQNLVADILLRRDNNITDKQTVLGKALLSYAKYGPDSPFTNRLSKAELLALKPSDLTDLLRSLHTFKHEMYYTGPATPGVVTKILKEEHKVPANLLPVPAMKKFKEKETPRDQVLFVNFPMVQVDLMLLSKGTPQFNLEEYKFTEWYNQYFGYGLSSIVFQEIRESKALAYSAYAVAGVPAKKKQAHALRAYVGTQPDKLREAVSSFQAILEDMPVSLPQIETARQSILRQIAAGRIAPGDLYWTWRANKDKGYDLDLRQTIYEHLQQAKAEDLIEYQKKYVKGRHYTWLVVGERDRIDFKYLRTIGKVTELSLEQIFGY